MIFLNFTNIHENDEASPGIRINLLMKLCKLTMVKSSSFYIVDQFYHCLHYMIKLKRRLSQSLLMDNAAKKSYIHSKAFFFQLTGILKTFPQHRFFLSSLAIHQWLHSQVCSNILLASQSHQTLSKRSCSHVFPFSDSITKSFISKFFFIFVMKIKSWAD